MKTFISSYEEKHLLTLTSTKLLSWNQHYPGHTPTPTIFQSPYSFAQTANPYVKLSFHQILEPSQFTITSTPYHLPFWFSGSFAILQFQTTIELTKQPKKLPPLSETQSFVFLFLVPFRLSLKQFAMLYQHTNLSP